MTKLSDLLKERKGSGVYRIQGIWSINDLERLAVQHGLAFFLIDGLEIRGKDQFLKTAAAALAFPDYFGANWDAFEDCLTDMAWYQADGYVILYAPIDHFAENDRDEFGTAMEIFKESAEFWRGQGKIMVVLLSGTSDHVKWARSISL